jgi:NAD(P)-dependent dehydrogenase (short-subunit alcohol dehydrogenase family)
MRADFEVNAVGTAEMFRVCWPLMEGRSGTVVKRLAVVSSSVGSIGCLGEENMPATAYGMSKAAQNWWARKVSLDFGGRGLAVVVLHPG